MLGIGSSLVFGMGSEVRRDVGVGVRKREWGRGLGAVEGVSIFVIRLFASCVTGLSIESACICYAGGQSRFAEKPRS